MSKEAKKLNPLTMTDQELIEHCNKQVQALRMALDMIECEKHDRRHVRWAIVDALKEWQPAQQEPVGYVAENGVVDWNVCAPPIMTDLYTSPPAQRPWVGLTDEQVSLAAHNIDPGDWNDLRLRDSWHNGFKEGARWADDDIKENT